MRNILKHFDFVNEADQQLNNLAQQLDSLADSLDGADQNDKSDRPKKPRDNVDVYGRKRQK
jgi:hypothetical protein